MVTMGCMFILSEGVKELNFTYRWLFSRVPVVQAFVETSLCDSSSANTRHTTKRQDQTRHVFSAEEDHREGNLSLTGIPSFSHKHFFSLCFFPGCSRERLTLTDSREFTRTLHRMILNQHPLCL